ncbi:hypothetical protein AOLI_G00264290 [Acnodon oligacanthus]
MIIIAKGALDTRVITALKHVQLSEASLASSNRDRADPDCRVAVMFRPVFLLVCPERRAREHVQIWRGAEQPGTIIKRGSSGTETPLLKAGAVVHGKALIT